MKNRTRNRRGFTLLEVIIAMVATVILVTGMGSILMLMFTGLNESRDFQISTARVDLIRHLTFDGRTGSNIDFPAVSSNGQYTAYTSTVLGASVTGHRVVFTASDYDPATGVTTPTDVRWESQTIDLSDPDNTSGTDTVLVVRYIEDLTATSGTRDPIVTASTDWIEKFQESGIDKFWILRDASLNNFTVEIESSEGTEEADVQLSVTLRNVTQ